MIKLLDAATLARAKLHAKRGTLAASIIVASLLFSLLIAAVIIFSGAQKSAEIFIKKSGNNQYLVKVSPVIPNESVSFSQDLSLQEVREIKAFEKQYYDKLRVKYEKLGLDYTQSIEEPALLPVAWKSENLLEELRVKINFSSPAITALQGQKYQEYAETATNKFSDLKKIAVDYEVYEYYKIRPSSLPPLPSTRLIVDGKEDFGVSRPKRSGMSNYGFFINAMYNSQYRLADDQLLSRYLLDYKADELKGIPVVVSAEEAAALFGDKVGIGDEPKHAGQKIIWLKEIQDKLGGKTYQACYRNSAEQAMFQQIQRDYALAQASKSDENYVEPDLLYGYPESACGDIEVKKDTRSADEKQMAEVKKENQQKLGTYVEPQHRLLTFQIVGFINAEPYSDYSDSLDSYVKNLLTVNNPMQTATIPLQSYKALPDELKLGEFDDAKQRFGAMFSVLSSGAFAPHILGFKTIESARAFMENEACPRSNTNCDKKFYADPYGSNYLILDEIRNAFYKVASIAFPIVLALAAVIIWFTISRIMTESRKETAVYRAVGAKRSDIVSIYLIYIALLAGFIALVSLVIGIAVAYAVDLVYGAQLTDVAVASFGIIDNAPYVSLFDISSPLIWLVIGSVFLVSFVASIHPLLRNVWRPPINDIREE